LYRARKVGIIVGGAVGSEDVGITVGGAVGSEDVGTFVGSRVVGLGVVLGIFL
jgi:hypothetical protein